MGQVAAGDRFVHLYINGQYWGLYETDERPEASFGEAYLGGDREDYDVIKNDSSGSRALEATDGTMDAYRRLYDAAVAAQPALAPALGVAPGELDALGPEGYRLISRRVDGRRLALLAGGSRVYVLVNEGTAGTAEESIRYGWNYALLLAEGPSERAITPSPVMTAMLVGESMRRMKASKLDNGSLFITILA